MESRQNDQPIKDILKLFVEKYRLKAKLHQTKLDELWGKLMGPTIAGYTRELRMRGKKLYVTVDSAPLRQELSMGKEKLRNLLNEALGEEYIKDVIIR
jgi:predicted nucleic acid-binding Zn ribbon protein